MLKRRSNERAARRGSVLVLVAFLLTALLAVLALAVDGGTLFTERRHAQATADAAALAAAVKLYTEYPSYQGTDPNNDAYNAAMAVAAENGYSNDGTTSTVVVNIPPKSGPYAGKSGYCEVLVTYQETRGFSKVLGTGTIPVKARAVSRGVWIAPNAGVIVLDYSGKGTLNDQGNGALTDVGAPIIVNSNNSAAAIDTGNGIMSAPEFDITGGYSISGSGKMVGGPIYTGVHPTPDPLAYLPGISNASGDTPPPPPQSIKDQSPTPGVSTRTSLGSGNYQYDLYPGSYSNLPNFSTGDVVNFHQASTGNGGIFYLTSGGLNSQGATLQMASGESGGMMIYNAGTGTNDKINITGNSAGTVNLSPLTSGPYSGLTIFQARNATENLQIAGNGNFTIYGTLYAAGAQLQVAGNGSVSNIGSQYVSLDLSITGNGNVSISYNPNLVAKTRIITLVE